IVLGVLLKALSIVFECALEVSRRARRVILRLGLVVLVFVDPTQDTEGLAVAPGLGDELFHERDCPVLVAGLPAPVQRECEQLPYLRGLPNSWRRVVGESDDTIPFG